MAKPRTILHELVDTSPELRASTKKTYLRDLDQYVAFAGEDPAGWTRTRTSQFYQHLLDAKMKPQSANRLMASIRYAAQWRAKRENNDSLDFSVIPMASNKASAARETLSEANMRALLDTCHRRSPRDLRDLVLLVASIETGMRRMSLASMAWEGIKPLPYPTLAVPLKGRDDVFPVPISDTLLAAFGPWRKWLATKKVFKGAILRRLDHHLSGMVVGAGISPSAIYAIMQERAAQAQVGHIHPHLFRHTFITWRMQAGLTPLQIASITGHRLPGDGSGSLYTYTDKKVLGEIARTSTPPWLAAYVDEYVKGCA